MADVFISYLEKDRALAQQLAAHLEAQGKTAWWTARPTSRQVSDPARAHEFDNAVRTIVIWTKASIGSPFILHEAITARDSDKLVQVKASDVALSEIPRALRSYPVFDVTDFEAITRALAEKPGAELAIDVLLEKRGQFSRLIDERTAAETTTIGRSPQLQAPMTRASPPERFPSASMQAPELAGRGSFRLTVIALVTGVAAALAIVVAVRTGALDALVAKLLGLLKWNVFPPVAPSGQFAQKTEIVDCSVFAPASAPAGQWVSSSLYSCTGAPRTR